MVAPAPAGVVGDSSLSARSSLLAGAGRGGRSIASTSAVPEDVTVTASSSLAWMASISLTCPAPAGRTSGTDALAPASGRS